MPSYKKYNQEIVNPDPHQNGTGLSGSAANSSYGSNDNVITTPDITATGPVW